MQIIKYPEKKHWNEILERPLFEFDKLMPAVQKIMNKVKKEGDSAVREFTHRFDKVELDNFGVKPDEIKKAAGFIKDDLKKAIQSAAKNIEKFHQIQFEPKKIVETAPGVKCWRTNRPIEKVGLYIPGGTAPLFSSVLMLAIPAKIAGCKEIILCSPPDKNGQLHPAILYAAHLSGITKIFKVGGAQAIAAMTFGTERIPSVYKILGPGNQYVTMAKMLAANLGTAIDMPAGPSEVMVVADKTANPAFIAADLLSQAEHGIDSQSVLLTTSKTIIENTLAEIKKQLKELPRQSIAEKAIENSMMVLMLNKQQIIEMMNQYAPEHLILSVENYADWEDKVINAGSVFLGNYSPESAGDYASGTNHTLPTNGYARAFSGVSLDSFLKKITFQEISQKGLQQIGNTIEIMAENEALIAHKNAVSLRLEKS